MVDWLSELIRWVVLGRKFEVRVVHGSRMLNFQCSMFNVQCSSRLATWGT